MKEYDITKLKSSKSHDKMSWSAKRTGRSHLAIKTLLKDNSDDYAIKYLESKALSEPSSNPLDLMAPLTGWRKLAEYLYIMRPLLYVICIRKWGKLSYRPWFISLVTELCCYFAHMDLKKICCKKRLSDLEREEISRRRNMLFYYLLRIPFYIDFTK